jgi:anaerobic dimethyl sulfoxide reductase subunit C (anchor subunit)
MAVGTFLVLATLILLNQYQLPEDVKASLLLTTLLTVSLLLILGLFSALLHLNHRVNAKFVLSNLKNSWLSREAISGMTFGATSIALILTHLLTKDGAIAFTIFSWLGVLSGVVLIYSMSRIYTLRTVPVWNTWVTPLSFLISVLLLGLLLLSNILNLLFRAYAGWSTSIIQMENLFRTVGWVAATVLSLQLILSFIKDRVLVWRGGIGKQSVRQVKRDYFVLVILRGVFGLLGIALCILLALPSLSFSDYIFDITLAGAFLLALTSESIGRYLFFASFKRSGL